MRMVSLAEVMKQAAKDLGYKPEIVEALMLHQFKFLKEFILIIKGLVLLLASFGLTHIWLAVFADVGVAICAIFFALGFINQGKYETLRH